MGYQVQLLYTADEENEAPKRLSNLQQTHQRVSTGIQWSLDSKHYLFCNYLH